MEKSTRPLRRGRRRALALVFAGALLAAWGIVRAVLYWWHPVPETWDVPREATLDAALLGGGLLLGLLGTWLYRRALARGRGTPATFLTADEEARVVAAIGAAERRTSGEVRLHLHGGHVADVMATARETFERLGMTATQERNGVLFFVAVQDRRFAVLGDAGIDRFVAPAFWTDLTHEIEAGFRRGDFAGALSGGIGRAAEALAEHFPRRADDVDELPDEISRT